ncbi:hypothetical protein V9T40_007219 [Parthenolecanium corni]|uniref:AN1-type domain-containing protein n=1 Tax=Parthenolecanium corni TaxID=536013 RepID=A0AAN9YAK2_9HEMI
MTYSKHNCSSAYKKNVQVPVCPLCNKPVPVTRGVSPDVVVGSHIDNDCKSDRATQDRNKVFNNKCSLKGCKVKEIVPVICADCRMNFCFKHRHVADHHCGGLRKQAATAALARQKQNQVSRNQNSRSFTSAIQGSMSEDEALARAVQLSMEDAASSRPNPARNQQQSCRVS